MGDGRSMECQSFITLTGPILAGKRDQACYFYLNILGDIGSDSSNPHRDSGRV